MILRLGECQESFHDVLGSTIGSEIIALIRTAVLSFDLVMRLKNLLRCLSYEAVPAHRRGFFDQSKVTVAQPMPEAGFYLPFLRRRSFSKRIPSASSAMPLAIAAGSSSGAAGRL
jgi:hypothetical protein